MAELTNFIIKLDINRLLNCIMQKPTTDPRIRSPIAVVSNTLSLKITQLRKHEIYQTSQEPLSVRGFA